MVTSLRLRVFVAILAVALAPLAVVFAWSQVDKDVPGRKWGDVRDAMDEGTAAVTAKLLEGELQAEVERIAERRRVRLRIFRDMTGGTAAADADADAPVDAFHRVEAFFFGAQPTESVHAIDASFGRLDGRPEVMFAARGTPFIGCQYRTMLFCQAVRVSVDDESVPFVVIAQASSHRAVQPVYLLRQQLLRIMLLTLPIAILLASYASRRIVRPLARLRAQALDQAQRATRSPALLHHARDEVGDLAGAFNVLLAMVERKHAESTRIAADLAHDLKNPVAAIRAAAEQLDTPRGTEPERVKRLSRLIGEAAGKLDRVVTHFLELARAEAGLPSEERGPVALGALLEGIAADYRDDARAENVTITTALEAEPLVVVDGVEHRLETLFRELVENAVSFAGNGGLVRVQLTREGARVCVSVTDSGPGISPEDLPRIFERFFTKRARARGTGLGLALVKAVAEAHGGEVSVESPAGRGATFAVRLPASR